jgi:hypothetical protein
MPLPRRFKFIQQLNCAKSRQNYVIPGIDACSYLVG